MTGIEGIGRPGPLRQTRRTVGKSTFKMAPEGAASGPATAAAETASVALGSMLTLQEFGDPTVPDRDARRHGQDMLAALAELQRALLLGDGDAIALQRLADLAGTMPHVADRQLAALLSTIAVRVRVELARRSI